MCYGCEDTLGERLDRVERVFTSKKGDVLIFITNKHANLLWMFKGCQYKQQSSINWEVDSKGYQQLLKLRDKFNPFLLMKSLTTLTCPYGWSYGSGIWTGNSYPHIDREVKWPGLTWEGEDKCTEYTGTDRDEMFSHECRGRDRF